MQANLAANHAERVRAGYPEAASEVDSHGQQALEFYEARRFPEGQMRVLGILSETAFDLGRWAEARTWLERSLTLGRGLCLRLRANRAEEAVWQTRRYDAMLAYCLVQQGERDGALVRLERGKARFLAESLRLEEARLSAATPELRDEIRRASEAVRRLEGSMREADPAKGRELAESLRRPAPSSAAGQLGPRSVGDRRGHGPRRDPRRGPRGRGDGFPADYRSGEPGLRHSSRRRSSRAGPHPGPLFQGSGSAQNSVR